MARDKKKGGEEPQKDEAAVDEQEAPAAEEKRGRVLAMTGFRHTKLHANVHTALHAA